MSLLLGKPIKIEKLPSKQARGVDWYSILQTIPKGYAQQVKSYHSTVKFAIEKLTQEGKIHKGEYSVRSRKQGNTRLLYILHHDLEQPPAFPKSETSPSPTLSMVVDFILTRQNNYEHTLQDIQMQFYGKALSSRSDATNYHRSYRLAREARKEIEKRYEGTFREEMRSDGAKAYRFHKIS